MGTVTLRTYLNGAGAKRFRRGRHDCVTIGARWVQHQAGIDVLEGHTYSSLAEGMRKLEAHGLASHADIFARKLARVEKLRLVAGDLAVVPEGDTVMIGIVMSGGERVWCFGPRGAASCPITTALYGFEVPR